MSNFKEYLNLICEGDIISDRAKEQAKQRGLVHQSHNIWKDKQGQLFKYNDQGKRFEKVEKKQLSPEKSETIRAPKGTTKYKEFYKGKKFMSLPDGREKNVHLFKFKDKTTRDDFLDEIGGMQISDTAAILE